MSVSPSIEIKGNNPELTSRQKLVYIAEVFRATLKSNPQAILQINGLSANYNESIARVFERLAVPGHKIGTIVLREPAVALPSWFRVTPTTPNIQLNVNGVKRASVYIDYGAGNSNSRKLKAVFTPDGNSCPFEKEFTASQDGTILSGFEGEWASPLKKVIGDFPRLGIRTVKIATKIVGLADFERSYEESSPGQFVEKIETELKLKLKTTFSMFLKTRGHEYLQIQFYGAIGAKYADEKIKILGETGLLFVIPFDLTDVIKN